MLRKSQDHLNAVFREAHKYPVFLRRAIKTSPFNKMDTSPSESNNGLLFANFNQDFGCFVAVSGSSFRIFNSDPLREKEARIFPPADLGHDTNDGQPAVTADATLEAVGRGRAKIVKAEMLFRCNYVALVVAPIVSATGSALPASQQGHKVVIWDDLKQMGVIQLKFNAEVRGVKLRRDRIVVVLKSMIKVYTFTAPPQQLHVFDTATNWRGLCSLSPSSNNSLLAFPAADGDAPTAGDKGTSSSGNVKLIDLANTDKSSLVIPAHASK